MPTASACLSHPPELLFTRSRHWNNKRAVLLRDEVFARAGCAAVGIFFLDLDDELLGRFKCQANFAARRRIHGRRGFFRVVRRKIDKLDCGYFLSGFSRLHHLVETENRRVGSLRVKERFQCGCIFPLERGLIFVRKRLLLGRCACENRQRDR